jgi:hypothetical protein
VTGVVLDAELPSDDLADALASPHIAAEAVEHWASGEKPGDLGLLLSAQAWDATLGFAAPEGLDAAEPGPLEPLAHGALRDA